jgi:hypothetical protein
MKRYNPPPMTLAELVRMLQTPQGAAILGRGIAQVVEEQQFRCGYPISYVKDGWVVREFPDGRIERLARV